HLVLKAKQIQNGEPVLRATLVHKSLVAEAQVLQFPKDLNVKVAAGAEVTQVIIPPAAEVPARQRPGRVGGGPPQQDTGNERPQMFLAEPRQGRLDEGLLRGQLRTVRESQRNQVIDRLVFDERYEQMRGLQRLDKGGGVQPQNPHQVRARDPPALAGCVQGLV